MQAENDQETKYKNMETGGQKRLHEVMRCIYSQSMWTYTEWIHPVFTASTTQIYLTAVSGRS